MPALTLSPALSALVAFTRLRAPEPLHALLRSTRDRIRPPRPRPYRGRITTARDRVLAEGKSGPRQLARVLCETRLGSTPTIVLGGFVPDATEQVFLLRGYLLSHGSVYYVNYPRYGFCLDLICAQLDDLVADLSQGHGQRPVIVSASFGCGIALEWLRRCKAQGLSAPIAGSILVSPVACAEDILTRGEPKPTTLVGRALKPYVGVSGDRIDPSAVERSRAVFAKMFEAGSHNRESLKTLMTRAELARLKEGVMDAIRSIDATGACERVGALVHMKPLSAWDPDPRLSDAPTLVLYAEKESSVIAEGSPTRQALEQFPFTFFPQGQLRVVTGGSASPVQHASLIFHYYQFLPYFQTFYRGLKTRKFGQAA